MERLSKVKRERHELTKILLVEDEESLSDPLSYCLLYTSDAADDTASV